MIITEEKYNEKLTRYVLPFIRLNFEDGYMKSADGTRIHYGYVATPAPKAAIVISHGFTECMPKYYEMIYYFAKAGYAVYMVEHRGHGYSDRSVSDMSQVRHSTRMSMILSRAVVFQGHVMTTYTSVR